MPSGDPQSWWSRAYWIPAGRYAVSGVARDGFAPCNDRECFAVGDVHFETRVGLAYFRVRATSFEAPGPRLRLLGVFGARPLAQPRGC